MGVDGAVVERTPLMGEMGIVCCQHCDRSFGRLRRWGGVDILVHDVIDRDKCLG